MFVFAVRARARVRALRVEESVTASPTTSRVSSEVEQQQLHKGDQVLGSSGLPRSSSGLNQPDQCAAVKLGGHLENAAIYLFEM